MRVKIWGCRGPPRQPRAPAARAARLRDAGNPSCAEVSLDGGSLLVLDAGTGIRCLGDALMERGITQLHLLLTHLHLDHLEGLRFFGPLWNPNGSLATRA